MFVNKKAQIGETMTWVVATIIIIVTLIVSLFISSSLSDAKELIVKAKDIASSGEKIKFDVILEKSVLTYFLSAENKKQGIYLWAEENEEMFYGNFNERVEEIERGLN
jgi:hypothetical protein